MRNTQAERILLALESREVVTVPQLMRMGIANFTARISELRDEGYVINNEIKYKKGVRCSSYRLERVRYGKY